MKKIFLSLTITLFCISQINAQVAWMSDLELAKALAKQNGKLLMVDFWAVWCGPCKKMDREVWNTEEGKALSQKFIPVKIDIDYNRPIALKYNIKSIPAVFFIDVTGEKIIDQIGYSHKDDILNLMKNLPADVSTLNSNLASLETTEDAKTTYAVATAYQSLVNNVDSDKVRKAIINRSNDFLRQASKMTEDKEELQKIELTEIHNLIYRGAHKRAVKKLEDNQEDFPGIDKNESYMNYLYVLAYRGVGDKESEKKYFQQLEARADGSEYVELISETNK